jgi:hypothetical protein
MMTSRFIIAVLLMIAEVGDCITTNIFTRFGGVEVNPIMAFVQLHLGGAWFLPKIAISAITMILIIKAPRLRLPIAATTIAMTPVIINTLQLI